MIGSSLGVFHKSSSKEREYTRQQRERACDNDARGAERYGRAYSGGYRRHRQRLRIKRKMLPTTATTGTTTTARRLCGTTNSCGWCT
jgi:ABC-type microcin C transport system duplicated ATPase subunit YejF